MKMKFIVIILFLLMFLNGCVFGADDDLICPTSVEDKILNIQNFD